MRSDTAFTDPPQLPHWLARELPFRRRSFTGAGPAIHFVDEGEGPAVLLVHGNPTWSFLWREVIRMVAGAGRRVIAPDLFGFGLSEKPRRLEAHQLALHIQRIRALIEALDLDRLTVVGQDWGGPIAAGVAARLPSRAVAMVLSNTSILRPRRPFRTTTFHRLSHVPLLSDALFRGLAFPIPTLPMVQGSLLSMGPAKLRAYFYPFRDPRDRAGPLALARMVPNAEDHPSVPVLEELDAWARSFTGPVSLVWGLRDPILGRALARHREALPHAEVIETAAGHFLQEEVPEVLAAAIVRTSARAAPARRRPRGSDQPTGEVRASFSR